MNKKKILLIMPFFYKYHLKIKNEMEIMGYDVTLCNERPLTLVWEVLHFLSKKNRDAKNSMKFYHNSIIKKASKHGPFDYFILIRGEEITQDLIKHIKNNNMQKKGGIVYYAWDSFNNFKKSNELFPLFDYAYTFDPDDFKKYSDMGLKFLPLFFISEYGNNISQNTAKKDIIEYDVCAVATYHKKRYDITKKFSQMPDIKVCSHIYISPDFYVKLRLIDGMKNLDKKIICFHKLSHEKIISYYKSSIAVLDVPSPNQSGLTIRTL
ncbi:MAG: hypothetical protein FWG34_11190, partial [Oscillospiraceae bacterium]|nr:hypothetical protein [Oscillospiraceae bacterium]